MGATVHDRSQMTLSCLWQVPEIRWCVVGSSQSVLDSHAILPGNRCMVLRGCCLVVHGRCSMAMR